MICDCCGRPIEGEPQEIIPDSATGAAATVYVHPYPCRPAVPRKTTPTGRGA